MLNVENLVDSLLPTTMAAVKENNGRVIYVDCNPNDELHGEKLQSIIGYTMSTMGVACGGTTGNSEHNFESYCAGLGNRLGPYEPYSRQVRLQNTCKQKLHQQMKALLPKKQPEFEVVLDQAADHLEQTFQLPVSEIGKLFYNCDKKIMTLAEFMVTKVFIGGDNMQISPCILKVTSTREQGSAMLGSINWTQCEVDMAYEERTYVLNKFRIKRMIKRMEEEEDA